MADQNQVQQWHVTEPYLDLHCQLGEGPYFEKGTQTLRFVDIKQKRLHTVLITEGPDSLKTLQLDSPIGVTANIQGQDPQEKILVALKYGIALLDRKTGQYDYLTRIGGEPDRMRSNDGAVDPHGRFWLGTMNDFHVGEPQSEGSLYRFDLGKSREEVESGLIIPNSIGWSPDGKTMYFTHTPENTIFAWDYNPEDGSLSNKRVHYKHKEKGHLDGFRVDKDGNIWHALYDGGSVIKISPAGDILGRIILPTNNITCVEFVGTELFITSAADEDSEEGTPSRKYGGGLFRVDVGTTGLDHTEFKLE
ncbi:uncharacterized protein B0T23DRAFT_121409 [Neurospora hispaniola]|uniref:SMP-30/Gluconolactonase/LRE-like region domain-containing protein n=1 Tax=Neurospora hispaniola TaxID=588809 RepID=A0AAJ0IAI3_9PEZI|nr:hypothetical protein B0T23DRAFT_121409 [Neurospora hispaniola]